MFHPFHPLISNTTRFLLIGTLPPEGVLYYFSNSCNTRLWDILATISEKSDKLKKNSIFLPNDKKEDILKSLNAGIFDVIYEYEREDMESTKDQHIIPIQYNNIVDLAMKHDVKKLLFVYQNAAKWFLHSLDSNEPVRISRLNTKIEYGNFKTLDNGIECILLPSPLNRGKKGETLDYKLLQYKKWLLGDG
jgi:G:T/U-mismatch repair DNA glycosylase